MIVCGDLLNRYYYARKHPCKYYVMPIIKKNREKFRKRKWNTASAADKKSKMMKLLSQYGLQQNFFTKGQNQQVKEWSQGLIGISTLTQWITESNAPSIQKYLKT